MRLVFVTRHTPWREWGGTYVRNAAFLRGLATRTELHVLFIPSAKETYDALPTSLPYTLHLIPYDTQQRAAARALIRELNPDVLWHSWKFSILRVGKFPNIPTVLDMVDVLWLNTRRTAAQRRGIPRMRAYANSWLGWYQDHTAARMADLIVLVNLTEKSFLRTARPILQMSNGVPIGAHCPPYQPLAPRLIFLADFLHPLNRDAAAWFLQAVLPRLCAIARHAQIEFVGQGSETLPFARVGDCIAHGFVQDLEPLLRNAAGMFVPLCAGTGIRNKILYGWMYGLPVISTTLGADGLGACNEKNILLADDAETFARACARILDDPALGARLAANAFAHAKANYDWEMLYPRLDEILDAAIRSHRAR